MTLMDRIRRVKFALTSNMEFGDALRGQKRSKHEIRESEFVSMSSEAAAHLMRQIDAVPYGLEIRRIVPNKKGNRYSVSFRGGVKYYSETLIDAFDQMMEKSKSLHKAMAAEQEKEDRLARKLAKAEYDRLHTEKTN